MGQFTYNVFRHLTAENSTIYRLVLQAFVRAKSRFIIHLRPGDVEQTLRENRPTDAAFSESMLQQLVEWGNLEVHPDTSHVATVEDFWRIRNLYQISAAGEAAERALALFDRSVREPGELQAAALDEIQRHLTRIVVLTRDEAADDVEVAEVFKLLYGRFDDLTAQAQRFMGGIQRRIDLQSLNVESFLTYKQRLIEYLERFLRELVMATHAIAFCLTSIKTPLLEALLNRVADRELLDRLIVSDEDRLANRREWLGRWDGLRAWFVGTAGRGSQAEELRSAARSAIPALVATVAGINERRAGQSDRSADYTRLALWFAETTSDADAHRLWRSGFALHSCRHLSVPPETVLQWDERSVESSTRWVDAPPIVISPRLHQSGRYTPRGRPATVIDRSAEKARLAHLAAEESAQLAIARRSLFTHEPVRLSQLPELDGAAFQLLLDLIGDALASSSEPGAPMSSDSSDGSIRIELTPTGDGQLATVRTSSGVLIGDDHFLWIRGDSVTPTEAPLQGATA